MRLPYSHLNLRFNPFGEADRSDRARLAVVELPPWSPGRPLQFIGDCGHGKTTHLLALQARYPESRYHRLDEGQDRLPRALPEDPPLIVDEAQRLQRSALRALMRRRGPVALGTHVDLSALSDRPFITVRLSGWTLARVREIVERRVEWARRGPGPVPTVSDARLRTLIARHRDDIRAMEGELYDVFQRLEEVRCVEV